MYSRIIKFLSSPRTIYWAKTLSKFLSLQLVIQALNALSGILIVRTLSKQEYAYFTIANSLQSTMNILSDSGITSGLLVIGGRIWQNPYEMGRLTNTVLKLRFVLALLTMPIVTVTLGLFLINAGASIAYTIIIVAGILIELFLYLHLAIFQVHLQLHSLFNEIQQQNLIVAFARLSLIFTGYLTKLNASLAIWISTVSSGLNFWLLKKLTTSFFQPKAPAKHEYENELVNLLKYHLPLAIFLIFQGQLTVWLITIFGSTNNVAEVGALSRLGTIFLIFTPLITNIVQPIFAKSDSTPLLKHKYLLILSCFVFGNLLLLSISYLFPHIFLWILGTNYSELKWEVFLTILSQSTAFISSVAYCLNYSRGWMKYLWITIPCTISFQVLIIFFLDLSETKGAILFGILSQIPSLVVNFYSNYLGLSQKYN